MTASTSSPARWTSSPGPRGTVNIVGNCQGGWEATLSAALHPERVNTLVVAGAPIDASAGNGPAKQLMPILVPRGNMALYEAMVNAFGGIVPGISNVMGSIAMDRPPTWPSTSRSTGTYTTASTSTTSVDYYDWYLYPVDLPGQLYLWAAEHLFVRNELFKGELEVAGQTVSLRSVTCPVFLLGGEEDDVTPWQQVHDIIRGRLFAGPLVPRTGWAHRPVHRPTSRSWYWTDPGSGPRALTTRGTGCR